MPSQYTHEGKLFKPKKAFFPTLTLPYIAGLTPHGHSVAIRNDYVEDISPEREDCDLVGITISTLHAVRGYELADAFRARGKKVVLGGFHATFMPDEAARHADAVVIGEAENILPKLIEDCEAGRLRRFYRMEEPHPLTGLPAPRYDLINYRKYIYRSIPVQTTRGCPHNCEYCTVTVFHGRKYRFRPVDEVVEELRRALREIRTHLIMFIDDNIAACEDYSRRLFEAIIPLHIRWVSQCTLNMADRPDLVQLAPAPACAAHS